MEKIQLKYIPLGILCAFLTKSLITSSTSINEVLMLALLTGLIVFLEQSSDNRKLSELKALINLKDKQIDEQFQLLRDKTSLQDKAIDELKGSVASVKITNGFRGIVNK